MDKHTALPLIAKAAIEASRDTGCPASLLAAQCALESGWLQHAPCNNCFGIKAYPGCVNIQLLDTTEWFTESERLAFRAKGSGRAAAVKDPNTPPRADGRREYAVRDLFATFTTLADCFRKRAEFWCHGRYAAAADKYRMDGDEEAYLRDIAPIYATDPHYVDAVLPIMRDPALVTALQSV